MARLYEWEDFLTKEERTAMNVYSLNIEGYKDTVAMYQKCKDGIRRKAVQRARNAMNKELRRKAKEESK